MPNYRARPNAILHTAIDRGLVRPPARVPSIALLSAVTGLHRETVRKVLAGQPVAGSTVLAVCQALAAPVEALFEPADDGPTQGSLRAVR